MGVKAGEISFSFLAVREEDQGSRCSVSPGSARDDTDGRNFRNRLSA